MVRKLSREVEKLKLTLDATHGHYQKQLELLGGGLGPLERPEGQGAGARDAEAAGASKRPSTAYEPAPLVQMHLRIPLSFYDS